MTGGFDLGFQWAGIETVWQVEIDGYCRKVLARHFPEAERFSDIRDCAGKEYLDRAVRKWYIPLDDIEYNQEEIEMAGKLKKLTQDQAVECVRLYESGLSLAPIAEYFNVSRQAMWDLLRRRTTLRSQKRYGKDNHFYRGGKSADDHAQNMVEYAARKGLIERKSVCEGCGNSGTFKDGRTKIQAHHSDYNKPLDVIWLCQECHHAWHVDNQAIRRKEYSQELPSVDILSGGFP